MDEPNHRSPITDLATHHQRHRVLQVDRLLLAPEMDDAPEPVLVARLAAVLHDELRNFRDVLRIHSETSVRLGFAERVDVAGAVDVVIRLLEENLHDFHGVGWRARLLARVLLRPRRVGRWSPARIPHEMSNGIIPRWRRIARLPR